MALIDELRLKTYKESIELLDKYGKACIIRPTGFGKTGILTKCIKKFKHVLYIYPANVIKDAVLGFYYNGDDITVIDNTTFMTYSKMVRLKDEEIDAYNCIDLIIVDECHRLGAAKSIIAMQNLISRLPDAKLLGATATPDRMDLIDEIGIFFDNHVVSKYTLHDAFRDGILTRPYYCFCSYGTSDSSDIERKATLEIEKFDVASERENAKSILRSRMIEISNITNMSQIIKNACDGYVYNLSNMKFIIFFSSFKHIHDKKIEITSWFQNAYPEHKVEMLIVSSETREFAKNTNLLKAATDKTCNTIELIACCDMLNMGYHVNDITGIIMYRGTESSIIYSQQLGRILNSGATNACIVFDVVDNIHREALYSVLGKQSKSTIKRKNKYAKLLKKLDTVGLSESEQKEVSRLKSSLYTPEHYWWTHANELDPQDLIATGHEATYRELIGKTVAEPISMRCRQAWARWVEKGGDPSNMTASAILGQKAPSSTPLSPFCKLKQVSVRAVLDEMGIEND